MALTAGHESKLFYLVVGYIVLNMMDSILTMSAIAFGYGQEANPAMSFLLKISPIVFVAVKSWLGAITAMILWHAREVRLARVSIYTTFAMYMAVVVWHFIGIYCVFSAR